MSKTKKKHPVLRFLRGLLIFLVLAVLITYLATVLTVRGQFKRGNYPDRRLTATYLYDDYAEQYDRDMVTFYSGENRLIGYVYGAENNDKGLIVWVHGIGSGHELYMTEILWFVDRGWQVLAYDATGSGYSEGTGSRGLAQSVIDLDAALSFVEQEPRFAGKQVMLFGHSWGGYAAASVLQLSHKVDAAVSVSGYNNPFEMLQDGAVDVIGSVPAMLDKPFMWVYNKYLFGDYAEMTAVNGINRSGVPVLVIHGEKDEVIGYDTISIIRHRTEITNPKAEFLTISGEYAGHSDIFSTDDVNAYLKDANARWKEVVDRYNGDTIPEDVREAFIETLDEDKCNAANPALMEPAEEFFEKYLKAE